jgi:membrane protease YdiL (CAAX protease family)
MNQKVWIIGWGTLLIFGLGGVLIIEVWQDRSFSEIMFKGLHPILQLVIGLLVGGISATAALYLINRPFFKEHKSFYYRLISDKIPLNYKVIIFLSICAGVGEEIFFRAGLQPIIGLWITSVIFVALHGYFSFSNRSLSLYGLLMLLIIAGFGYMYRYLGLISVITAHSFFDFILFRAIYLESNKVLSGSESNEESELHLEEGH